MEALVQKLHEICTRFPLQEKIIVVDSFLIGEQIEHALMKKGCHAVNVKYKTVYDLASELVEMNTENPIKPLDHTLGAHFTFEFLTDMKYENKLRYFDGMEITPSFSHALYLSIRELRLAGFNKDTLPIEAFLTSAKGEDYSAILEAYEDILTRYQFLDEADLLHQAVPYAKGMNNVIYVLQSNLHLSELEERLLTKLLPENVDKLPLAPVFGIQIPERTSLSSISWGHPTPLSYLYDFDNQELLPSDLTVFTAKTEETEVKHVFEQIKVSNKALDENIVFYTDFEPYGSLFYHLSQKGDIPITFGEGLPVSFSRPGSLVTGLMKWMQTNYSVEPFLGLIHEGLLDLGEEAPSGIFITNVLRDLKVGWSQERYLSQIEEEISKLEKKISLSASHDEYIQKRINNLAWLLKWFQQLFKRLPQFAATINYKQFLSGVAFILNRYSRTSSALDEIAKTSLLEQIERVMPYADEDFKVFDILEKAKDLLLALRVNQSRPKPGYLHVSSYKSGIYNSRPSIFIVGLDNRRFPGGGSEDPLLLDAERLRLGHRLPVQQVSPQNNLYTLLQVLANSTGKVAVSYCNFNIIDNRAVSPAHLFLQCYRFVSHNIDAEFKEVKGLPSPLIPSETFDDKDYWNKNLLEEKEKWIDEDIFVQFQNLTYGLEGEVNRAKSVFTSYDGLVEIEALSIDSSIHQKKTVTAGKLETLAKCPYSYFLQVILRVSPVEETTYDPYKWLDAATRGSLLHSIFEQFYKELRAENTKPRFPEHEEKIISIGMRLIEEEKAILPPPNERVFDKEVNDILECCRIFLKEEERHCQEYEPLYFEYAFGIGNIEPAEITLPSGEKIQVAGKIDRVDRTADGKYHIIDYKTGSTYEYGMNQVFKGGRQLQHLIYALAIESHLQLEEGSVTESAYYFPTVKGLAQRFVRKQNDVVRTNGIDILERLIEMIKNGNFTMTDDVNDCKFCEFKSVCRRSFYDPEVLETKMMDKEHEELKRFKGVRAYD